MSGGSYQAVSVGSTAYNRVHNVVSVEHGAAGGQHRFVSGPHIEAMAEALNDAAGRMRSTTSVPGVCPYTW